MNFSTTVSAQEHKPLPGVPGYETIFITQNELSDEGLNQLTDKIKTVIGQFQGETVLIEDWGKRKLAYSIRKENRGHYTYIVYYGKGDIVHEVERNLRLHEHVMRFLTVNLKREFDAEEFKKNRLDVKAAIKRREDEREARREERMADRKGDHYSDERTPGLMAEEDFVGDTGGQE